jgi:signal transduction histidine kinase
LSEDAATGGATWACGAPKIIESLIGINGNPVSAAALRGAVEVVGHHGELTIMPGLVDAVVFKRTCHGLAALTEAAYVVALWINPAEDPQSPVFAMSFVSRALSLTAVAVGLVWTLLRQRRTRLAIARLADDLGAAPEPGTLRAVLARNLDDPELEVVYRQPGSSQRANAAGQLVPFPTPPQVATPIVRNGEPVAYVYHRQGLQGPRVLEREIGAAARLAVDNERLRAAVLTHLGELRASRARIVMSGDAARMRIERDLHDGAQQRLLSLTYDLRLAHRAADAGGDMDTATVLATAGEQVRTALAELRDIAHGIHPVILTEAGLAPAVAALARTAPIPVEVTDVVTERLPAEVERTAYIVVAAGIAAAASTGKSYVEVSVRRTPGALTVSTEAPKAVPVSIADRVGALDGRITTSDGRLRADIPCG